MATDRDSGDRDSGPEASSMSRRARRNLNPVVIGQAVSFFGNELALFTLPLFVVALTGRERDLGLTAAAETLPMLLFGLAAGVLVDRVALRRSLILADLVRAAAFALLASAVALDAAELWVVLTVAFLVGTMGVFFDSGLQALMPSALTKDLLVVANSRLQMAMVGATVVGPVAAGLMVQGLGGFEVVFAVDAGTFVVSAAALLMVRELAARRPTERRGFGADLGSGLRFLWQEPRLRWATIGAAVGNLVFAPVAATVVLFAVAELGLESGETGLFFAIFGAIGALAAALGPRAARTMRLGRMFVVGMAMFGAGTAILSFSDTFVTAVVPMGFVLAGVSWLNISLATLRQRLAPTELLGRVIAASRTIGWAGLPLGAAAGGYIADAFGLIPVYRVAAIALLVLTGLLLVTPLWSGPVSVISDPDSA